MTTISLKTAAVEAMLGNPDDIDDGIIEEIVAEGLRGELNAIAGEFRRPGASRSLSLSQSLWRDAGDLAVASWIYGEAMRRMS